MASLIPANPELVAIAWLNSLSYTASAPLVGTTVPQDPTAYAQGFVQVTVVGGITDNDLPERKTVFQFDVYVPSINSKKPQWGRASAVAENIVRGTSGFNNVTGAYSLGAGFEQARVQGALLASDPRRVNNDPQGYARYTVDIQIMWVTA